MAHDERKINRWNYPLVFILSLVYLHVGIIQQAIGIELKDEPYISLKVESKPLGDVLKKIALDTDFKFDLNDPWSSYPVSASFENMPLHRGLKLILLRLNHTIVYGSNKSIKIVIYGNVGSRKTDSYPIQSFSPQIQDNQQPPAPSPELSPEETDDLKRSDDDSEEISSSENTEDESTEKEDASDNRKKESSKETGVATGKKLGAGTSINK